MPKATKLHSKGKTNTIQKPIKKDGTDNVDSEESMRKFQLELCWCIQKCERFLSEKKGSEKQMQDTWKVLAVLKNNNQPMIRKRQLMRTHFGDYRGKMAAEEHKLAKLASKIKISETPDKPKATFVRKSAFLTTGDSSFKFNFNIVPQEVDNGNTSSSTVDNTVSDDSNTKNVEVSNDGNSNDGNTKQILDVSNLQISDAAAGDTEQNSVKDSKKFKFSFTESQFKFNFNFNS